MLKKILVTILALIAVGAVFISLRPAEYTVSRSAKIPREPALVFGLVNNFHEWDKWSPWAKLDPQMQTTYAGPESGVNAEYAWKGNSDVGSGKMTITESAPYEKVGIRLEFFEPFASVAQTDFHFKPVSDGTEVTWTMTGNNGFVAKAFTLFMDMDAMIGADFEKGLNQLTAAAAALPAEEPKPTSETATTTP
jgi:hypothetical protein